MVTVDAVTEISTDSEFACSGYRSETLKDTPLQQQQLQQKQQQPNRHQNGFGDKLIGCGSNYQIYDVA